MAEKRRFDRKRRTEQFNEVKAKALREQKEKLQPLPQLTQIVLEPTGEPRQYKMPLNGQIQGAYIFGTGRGRIRVEVNDHFVAAIEVTADYFRVDDPIDLQFEDILKLSLIEGESSVRIVLKVVLMW